MERFARTIVGYHGCRADFARGMLLGEVPVSSWKRSENQWDWLGHGIYFWEHSPERAMRWSREKYGTDGRVLGAIVQLGKCFDLLDEWITSVLATHFSELARSFADSQYVLPQNRGRDGKMRDLDCLVINSCLDRLERERLRYDTVRGAFLEGEPVFDGAGFNRETHLQIAVRNPDCILGVFRPNMEET